MKIVEVQTFTLAAKISSPLVWSNGFLSKRETLIVKIRTDEGIHGWGETGNLSSGMIINHDLSPCLIGKNPLNRSIILQDLFFRYTNSNGLGDIVMSAISALDIALWDIAGKAHEMAIHEMLGGKLREKIAVYATGLYYSQDASADKDLEEETSSYIDRGFCAIKMKIGGLGQKEDLARVAKVREIAGAETKLMVDANQAYDTQRAIDMGLRLMDHDIFWFEEPISVIHYPRYKAIKQSLSIALAGGENLYSRNDFREVLHHQYFDIVQPNIGRVGGVTGFQKLVGLAEYYGSKIYPHAWSSPILAAATLHICAVIPPTPLVQNPQNFLQEPLLEMDCTPNPIRDNLCQDALKSTNGFLKIPDGFGLGLEVDAQALAHYEAK